MGRWSCWREPATFHNMAMSCCSQAPRRRTCYWRPISSIHRKQVSACAGAAEMASRPPSTIDTATSRSITRRNFMDPPVVVTGFTMVDIASETIRTSSLPCRGLLHRQHAAISSSTTRALFTMTLTWGAEGTLKEDLVMVPLSAARRPHPCSGARPTPRPRLPRPVDRPGEAQQVTSVGAPVGPPRPRPRACPVRGRSPMRIATPCRPPPAPSWRPGACRNC